jgi:DNA-directed RNA polymerase specialized sigma24 family protein
MRVHRRLARALDERDALRWIYRVATICCLQGGRRRRTPIERPPALTLPAAPDERIADRQLAQHLVRAMPARLRAVAWLYHVDGLEPAEVADILGLSRRTVLARLAALQRRGQAPGRRPRSGVHLIVGQP